MARFEIEVTRNGMWPFPWRWRVTRSVGFKTRCGDALTKERARRKAVQAMRSMECDDVEITVE